MLFTPFVTVRISYNYYEYILFCRFKEKHEYVLLDEMKAKSNQVLLVDQLEHIASSQMLTVAVTHLKAMPEYSERRLAQSRDLISKLKGLDCENLLLSGDFNFHPREKSYSYLSTQNEMPLKSVYGSVREPAYTCQWVDDAGGLHRETVDYIWYSGSGLGASGFYATPEKVKDMIFSSINPSDHWALIADFIIKS